MKLSYLAIAVLVCGLMMVSCRRTQKVEENTFDVDVEEIEDVKSSSSAGEDTNKLYAEKLLSECEQRVNSYIEYGRAIENVATKAYINFPEKENESYEDWKKRAKYKELSNCMSAFAIYHKELDIVYEKFYQQDYEAVVRLAHRILDGINSGYSSWHDKLLKVNLTIDQTYSNDYDNFNRDNSTFYNEEETSPSTIGGLDVTQSSDVSSPSGHYETRIERCIECQGRGYNEKTIWHGGDKTSTVQIRCSFCHGQGTITKREYVIDN